MLLMPFIGSERHSRAMSERRASAPASVPDKLLEEGAIWFARMRGPDADDFRNDFEKWLNHAPLHQTAYERAGEVFAMGRFLAAEHAGRGGVANDNGQRHAWLTWLSVAAALAIGLASSAFIFLGRSQFEMVESSVKSAALEPVQSERYVAGASSTLAVHLPDGSTATLAAGSVLTRKFSADRRELRLESGMARFEVAHERRPFVVLAGGGSVTARGTIFDVRLTPDSRVAVNLVRGVIDIERPREPDGSIAPFSRLEPGESVAFSIGNERPLAAPAGTVSELADSSFKHDEPRVFDRTPLAEVVAQTHAASGNTILFANPSIGQLRVSGRFRIDDTEMVADRLAALFGLEIDRTAAGELTLRKRD